MSQEVRLTINDYNTILSWYRIVFGTGKTQPKQQDEQTVGKITVMRLAQQEEELEWKQMQK